jgi:hypothetical protein
VSTANSLFSLIFLSIGGSMLGYGIHTLRRARRAARWPTVAGTILHSELDVDSDSDGTTYRVKVKYAYAVGGRHYESDQVAIGYGSSSNRQAHERLQSKLQGARTVTVHYDPVRPERAVMGAVVMNGVLSGLLFGAVWTGAVLAAGLHYLLVEYADAKLLASLVVR